MSKNSNPKNFAEGDRGHLHLGIIVTLVVNHHSLWKQCGPFPKWSKYNCHKIAIIWDHF